MKIRSTHWKYIQKTHLTLLNTNELNKFSSLPTHCGLIVTLTLYLGNILDTTGKVPKAYPKCIGIRYVSHTGTPLLGVSV
jgi:hypothetical protein